MLYEFLEKYEKNILELAIKKTYGISEDRPSSRELEKGLPIFYHDLITVLKKGPTDEKRSKKPTDLKEHTTTVAAAHGKESQRLGYTISQVVHGYGAICQSVTEYAEEKKEAITSWEFHELNLSLDIAIAQAVTQFEFVSIKDNQNQELLRLGQLAHELRNTLAGAILANNMILKGIVGFNGNTSRILSNALINMRDLIDRSLSEVRLKIAPEPHAENIIVINLISDIEVTSSPDTTSKNLSLRVEVDPTLMVFADRQMLESAVANLVQNAIKFTKVDSNIWIRGYENNGCAQIDVEDQCGGLPEGMAEELFTPFTQKSSDKSGLGLGLSISRQSIMLNKGTLSVKNRPGEGCIFSIILPKSIV